LGCGLFTINTIIIPEKIQSLKHYFGPLAAIAWLTVTHGLIFFPKSGIMTMHLTLAL
jgi:hypothetical protein